MIYVGIIIWLLVAMLTSILVGKIIKAGGGHCEKRNTKSRIINE